MPKKSKNNKTINTPADSKSEDLLDILDDEKDEEDNEEAIEEELAPDIAKALTPKKKEKAVVEIDYIPETDLLGLDDDDEAEEDF